MLRLCNGTRRYLLLPRRRPISSSSSSPLSSSSSSKSAEDCPNAVEDSMHAPPLTIIPQSPTASPSPLSRTPLLAALSATLASAAVGSYLLLSDSHGGGDGGEDLGRASKQDARLYDELQRAIDRSGQSISRVLNRMKQVGAAASVLWQSLRSVMSSANHEVRTGFELRVAALLADIAAANPSRRSAIVAAGGGAVLDWLLETVSVSGDGSATQAEAARALAYLIADPKVCGAVLGRPHAVPSLLRFIFSCQPQQSKKRASPNMQWFKLFATDLVKYCEQHSRHKSFDVSESLKGKSMLVTAIMDIVTSSCDSLDKASFQPSLPVNAEMGDIATAIRVIEEGDMHLDDTTGNEDDEDGGKGLRGIGIKILGGTTVLGLSRSSTLMKLAYTDASCLELGRLPLNTLALHQRHDGSLAHSHSSTVVIPGLWDDLHCQHVAVPFAAWALANWAKASERNRAHIQELDRDGHAVMTALMAPERTVKWHASLVARLLLEDHDLPLNDSVSDWSSNLLYTVSHASKIEDIPLAQMALSAFLISVERSTKARKVVMDKGLHLMRETAKRTSKHREIQEVLAKALKLLCSGDMHLSLQESQKWSGILMSWVFGTNSTDAVKASATEALSAILEDHGPYSVPISQGWLALLLNEILDSSKATIAKGSTNPKSDKVKTQIDQSNILSAAQIASQLAGSIVNLAGNQLGIGADTTDTFPLQDLFSLEPFAKPFKGLKKDSLPKSNAADSAVATLKGIKALTEICAEDNIAQKRIVDFGVLRLLRRFLLRDDYEKLAAIEAYDASRALEARDQVTNGSDESTGVDRNDPSSVRVPPTAHIRKHAARVLTILSLLPKARDVILADEIWCRWLEECANGKIPGCNDLKIQSYAKATLLNIFCNAETGRNSANVDTSVTAISESSKKCAHYSDIIFLINPKQPHWKCSEKYSQSSGRKELQSLGKSYPDGHGGADSEEEPLMDVVFVHGLRGGPYKTWRIADNKISTKSGLIEKIDREAGKQGTFWPGEWLSADFPQARLFTLKYKTNLTQWSGASLPLQEVSSMLLEKLVAAGIGKRPVVFVTHSMGGLVVKQMLYKAKAENIDNLVDNTIGVVFYSCPHFGSKLADMPWRMGLVLRPAPSIGELRSGSSRLIELNDYIRHLHRKGSLEVLSFGETKVTPIVEGYGGWAFRMEIVPIESAYPGFGELVVLESTDHINSCKPISSSDPSYTEMLNFLRKVKSALT